MWMERGRVKENSHIIQCCCIIQDITDGFCVLLLPYLHPPLQVESQLLLKAPCDSERPCLEYFEGDLKEGRGTVQMAWGYVAVQCC